jgi:hypothetical protein
MVREDVAGCDNSKEPSDFVKGEKFLEWFSDWSLLKDMGRWSSCELLTNIYLFSMSLGGHHGQLVRQISSCLQLQNCSGSRGGDGKYNNNNNSNNNNNKAFWKSTFPLSLQNKRAYVVSERASTEFCHILLKVMWTGLATLRYCHE